MHARATAVAVLVLAVGAAPAWAGNGGASYGAPKPAEKHKRAAAAERPVLSAFALAPSILQPGATPSVTFRVDARSKQVRLRLVASAGPVTKVVDLGRQPTRQTVTVPLPALADNTLPEGALSVRIAGRDTAGRVLRPAAKLSRVQQIAIRAHVFPLRGAFSYGDAGAAFGAGRNGHTHQGQDLFADEGTPVVAVRDGTIKYVEYQAGGAGYYVVLDADGEDFDYAFMHLKEGSTRVVQGQHVTTGELLAEVGHTGDAMGNHLHFEIWRGAWFEGGTAIDPRPFLEQWQTWSPVRALT